MPTEILAAIIGAIVGSIAGFGAAFLQSWQERKRRKRALASVLLLELRGIEYLLREFFKNPDNLTGDFNSDHFDRLDATVFELDGEAARLALSLKYRLDEIRVLRKKQEVQIRPRRRDTLKVKLWAAEAEVPKLKAALLASEGVEPPHEDYSEEKAGNLILPPRAFDYGSPEPEKDEAGG